MIILSSGKIEHDGKIPTTNETLSPTTERLNVLRWLEVLHPSLPNHVSNVFSQDLQTKSLKDLQPTICEQIDDLLRQVDEKCDNENVSASYSRFTSGDQRYPQKRFQQDYQKSNFNLLFKNHVRIPYRIAFRPTAENQSSKPARFAVR